MVEALAGSDGRRNLIAGSGVAEGPLLKDASSACDGTAAALVGGPGVPPPGANASKGLMSAAGLSSSPQACALEGSRATMSSLQDPRALVRDRIPELLGARCRQVSMVTLNGTCVPKRGSSSELWRHRFPGKVPKDVA
jgi:hypothetical protein